MRSYSSEQIELFTAISAVKLSSSKILIGADGQGLVVVEVDPRWKIRVGKRRKRNETFKKFYHVPNTDKILANMN